MANKIIKEVRRKTSTGGFETYDIEAKAENVLIGQGDNPFDTTASFTLKSFLSNIKNYLKTFITGDSNIVFNGTQNGVVKKSNKSSENLDSQSFLNEQGNFTVVNTFNGDNAGLVPKVTDQLKDTDRFLKNDGTWTIPPEPITYNVFNKGNNGLVPGPTDGDENYFLRGDGSWAATPDTNTTYSPFTAAVSSDQGGESGLVPYPTKGTYSENGLSEYWLNAGGSWKKVPDVSTTRKGLAPKLSNKASQYLNGQGAWADPTPALATVSTKGLMSAADKEKLNSFRSVPSSYDIPAFMLKMDKVYGMGLVLTIPNPYNKTVHVTFQSIGIFGFNTGTTNSFTVDADGYAWFTGDVAVIAPSGLGIVQIRFYNLVQNKISIDNKAYGLYPTTGCLLTKLKGAKITFN